LEVSGSVKNNYGSGWHENLRIQIRIHNTANGNVSGGSGNES
jgi:hypothetical protein